MANVVIESVGEIVIRRVINIPDGGIVPVEGQIWPRGSAGAPAG